MNIPNAITRHPRSTLRIALLSALCGFALACAEDTPELVLATPDAARFQAEVYPVLLRDCGFHACHGSSERFLQVFGPGRGRLDPLTQPLDPILPAEVGYSYERARSMIDAHAPEQSLLLRKPLSVEAGGAGHEGLRQEVVPVAHILQRHEEVAGLQRARVDGNAARGPGVVADQPSAGRPRRVLRGPEFR